MIAKSQFDDSITIYNVLSYVTQKQTIRVPQIYVMRGRSQNLEKTTTPALKIYPMLLLMHEGEDSQGPSPCRWRGTSQPH